VEKMNGEYAKKDGGFFANYSRKTWMYVVGLAIIIVVVFSGFFFSDNMLFSSDQLGSLDSKVFMRTSLVTHHQFPFWFSPRLGGMPTIDALFEDALYPPSIIFKALFPVHRALGLKMIFHIFLAGLFFFLMLRKGFNCSAPIAFIGAVFYMLNPEFFSHIYPGHDGKMYVIAWMPFMVWRLKALVESPKFFNASLLGFGIGFSLLTSHVQLTYFVLWVLFAYAVVAIIFAVKKHERGTALRTGLIFTLAVVIGLAIGSILLLPSLMFVHDAFSVRGAGRGFDYAASWSLHWPEFFSLWIPEFGNTLDYYWGGNAFKLNSEYAGGIVLLLAVIALAGKPKPWRFFWLGVAVFAVLYSMGAHTPVFYAAYYIIPGVKKFRACSMMMCWFSFSTVLLAILFLKDLLAGKFSNLQEKEKKRWNKRLLFGMGGIILAALFFSMKDAVAGVFPFVIELDNKKRQIFDANFSRNFVPTLWLWVFFAEVTLGMIVLVISGKLKPAVAAGIIFIFGFIDVARVNAQFIKVIDPRPYFYDEPVLQKLKGEMTAAPFRVFSLPGALPQNAAGVHGLEDVEGFHDNELRWYRAFRGDREDRNYFDKLIGFAANGEAYLKAENIDKGNAFLDIANVKYLLARKGNDLLAIENRNALGRISFAANFTVLDSSQILGALQTGGYDFRSTVALFSTPSQKPSAYTPDSILAKEPPLSATWQRYSPNDRIVKVTAPQDGFLRISEVYYPAWKVAIDGKSVPVYRADYAWMAVFLPKGEHVVEMRAHSLYFAKGATLSITVTVLLFLYWGTVMFLRKRKTNGIPS
jgi:hypothetical protein